MGVFLRDLVAMVLHFGADGGSQHRAMLAVSHMSRDRTGHRTFEHAVMLDRGCLLSLAQAQRREEESS